MGHPKSTRRCRDSRNPMSQNMVPGTGAKSVRRTRSHRMKFCVQKEGVWRQCPQQADGRKCECVLTLALLARSCVWLSTRIACLYLKQPKRPLCRCEKSTEIQALGGNDYEKDYVL